MNKTYKGERLEENGRSITIDTIIVQSFNDRTLIKALLYGGYNGWVEISDIPAFNNETKSLTAIDIQVKIKTKNILVKGLSWLLKGKINRKLRSLTNIPLCEYVQFLQNEIDDNLNKLNADQGIYVYATLGSFDIKHIELYQKGITGVIYIKAYLSSYIKSISHLQNTAMLSCIPKQTSHIVMHSSVFPTISRLIQVGLLFDYYKVHLILDEI